MSFPPAGYCAQHRAVNHSTAGAHHGRPIQRRLRPLSRASPSSTSPGPSKCSRACPARAACSPRSTAANSKRTRGMRFAGLRRLDSVEECDLLCVPGGFGTVAAVEDAGLSRRVAPARRAGALHHLGVHGLAAARGRRTAARQARGLPLGLARQARRLRCRRRTRRAWCATASSSPAAASPRASTWRSRSWRKSAAATYAETVQLAIEYAPAPPFDSGRPELAREPVLRAARARLDSMRVERDAAIRPGRRRARLTPDYCTRRLLCALSARDVRPVDAARGDHEDREHAEQQQRTHEQRVVLGAQDPVQHRVERREPRARAERQRRAAAARR